MNINSSRMYSNEEIEQMALVGFEKDFIRYLKSAPERVKQIVENMVLSEQARVELRKSYEEDNAPKLEVVEETFASGQEFRKLEK